MEIYHLTPNTTYEFRIWGNNYLGSGEIVATTVTTLPEIGDAGNFFLITKTKEKCRKTLKKCFFSQYFRAFTNDNERCRGF